MVQKCVKEMCCRKGVQYWVLVNHKMNVFVTLSEGVKKQPRRVDDAWITCMQISSILIIPLIILDLIRKALIINYIQ